MFACVRACVRACVHVSVSVSAPDVFTTGDDRVYIYLYLYLYLSIYIYINLGNSLQSLPQGITVVFTTGDDGIRDAYRTPSSCGKPCRGASLCPQGV